MPNEPAPSDPLPGKPDPKEPVAPNSALFALNAALFEAVDNDFGTKVAELLAKGADPYAVNGDGWSPLHVAARFSRNKALATLLHAGVDPNRPCPKDGQTPLHLAALDGHLDSALALLHAGADPEAVDNNGYTPHVRALHRQRPITSEVLSQAVANRRHERSEARSARIVRDEAERTRAHAALSNLRGLLGAVPSDDQVRALASTASLPDEAEFSSAVSEILNQRPTLAQRRAQREARPATPEEILAAERAVDDWIAVGNAPPRPASLSSAVRRASSALAVALEAPASSPTRPNP